MLKWLKSLFKKPEVIKLSPEILPGIPRMEPLETSYDRQLRAYRVAQKELGVREVAGVGDNPRIVEYLKATNLEQRYLHDQTYWCAAFANWVFDEAHLPKTNLASARSFLNWGQEIKDPKEGDLVVFKRGEGGHVGFIHRLNTFTISTLGGNENDCVCIMDYPRYRVLSYRRVK